jgi:nicotinate-nucleotide pyrophosphorylase (carboxylating)
MKPHTFSFDYSQPLKASIPAMVHNALAEDLGIFDDLTVSKSEITADELLARDVTAALVKSDHTVKAKLIARESGVLAGSDWFTEVFQQLSSDLASPIAIDWCIQEGQNFENEQVICYLEGSAQALLTGERSAMNFLQTLSGTATITQKYAKLLEGTDCMLLDTRKTLPGLRLAQKYAVTIGGGKNHRIGLFDAFLIKENHIMACGGISQAVQQAITNHPKLPVEIEVESLDECQQAINAKANIIMLDNFSDEAMRQAVKLAADTDITLEASGNITADNIRSVAATGVDYISIGAITKHLRASDFSFRIID